MLNMGKGRHITKCISKAVYGYGMALHTENVVQCARAMYSREL